MQHLEVSGAVRPLKWSLGVKWLNGKITQMWRTAQMMVIGRLI